ncbi:hypothetical protein LTR36_000917 [Oleoguttula mirabilis]|uniref:Uncharacterized protein n=1 Tax=Oleoguttula mirabilis TaxID=1507867 RepID=A0AAV9JNY2_9PEZI|nr:hypothetical protein LTR36_000917 [Oleoguttula mirabilis]
MTIEGSGGDPNSYVQAYCDASSDGPYDSNVLSQTINTCPGETYDFTLAYNMIQAETNNYLNIFANGQYIVSVQAGGNGLDSLGNPYDQWNFLTGTYTATSASTLVVVVCMAYDNTCANPAATRRLFTLLKRDSKKGTEVRPGLMRVEGMPVLVPSSEF